MKKILFFLLCFLISENLFCQFAHGITKDGKYSGIIINKSPNDNRDKNALVIQSSNGEWKKEILGCNSFSFSSDSKKVYYRLNNTLHIQQLGADKADSISNVISFALHPLSDDTGLQDS